MIRTTVPLLLVLLACAGPATAQQTTERTHVVTSGETLGSLATRYYGAASQWTRIFEANRDRLTDPNVVAVGVTLVIPDGPAGPVQVTGVEVRGAPVAQQDLLSYEARRELFPSRPFQPQGVPELPASERTVFFDVPDPGERANVIVLQSPELIPAFPPSYFHAAGWIVPAGDRTDRRGEVISVVGPGPEAVEASAQLYSSVRIRSSEGTVHQVGEEVLTYRMDRELPGIGELAIPTARLVVSQVGEGEAVAEVVQAFGWIRVGDLVAEGRLFPLEPGVHPTAPGGGLEGRLIALEEEIDIHVPGAFAFIDIGRASGLAIGDVLAGVADADVDWTGRALAYFQVVGLGEDTGTVRLLSTVSPKDVLPGLRVVVDRKMP